MFLWILCLYSSHRKHGAAAADLQWSKQFRPRITIDAAQCESTMAVATLGTVAALVQGDHGCHRTQHLHWHGQLRLPARGAAMPSLRRGNCYRERATSPSLQQELWRRQWPSFHKDSSKIPVRPPVHLQGIWRWCVCSFLLFLWVIRILLYGPLYA